MPSDYDRALISELFADRQESYDDAGVLRLTRISKARLDRDVTEGKLEPVYRRRKRAFQWEDVAFLALERWTPRMIHAVLRDFLPPLNQTAAIPVELPVYQIRVLHALAVSSSERGKPPLNVSDILERAVHLLLVPDYLEVAEPQTREVQAAAEFPSFQQLPRAPRAACRYCAAPVVADKDACPSCTARHEPPGRDMAEDVTPAGCEARTAQG